MNAPEPATIKDLIKHKVASEEKYSEKGKAAEQVLAAPVTGSVSGQSILFPVCIALTFGAGQASGPSDWEWQNRRTSEELEEKHESDRKRAKEEKKREEKEQLRKVAEAHGKALSQIKEDGHGEQERKSTDRRKSSDRRDSEKRSSSRQHSERRSSSRQNSERKSSERKDSARSEEQQ